MLCNNLCRRKVHRLRYGLRYYKLEMSDFFLQISHPLQWCHNQISQHLAVAIRYHLVRRSLLLYFNDSRRWEFDHLLLLLLTWVVFGCLLYLEHVDFHGLLGFFFNSDVLLSLRRCLFDLFVDNFDVRVSELDLISHGFFPFYSLHVNDDKDLPILTIFPLELLFFEFLSFLLVLCELLKSQLL